MEWADDAGTTESVRVVCLNPDCGEVTEAEAVTQYGQTSFSVEECPVCHGDVAEEGL